MNIQIRELIAISLGIRLIGPCTTAAAAPPATIDDEVYLSWNVDVPYILEKIIGYVPLVMISIPGRYKYVTFGIPIIAGFGLLNEKGLACVANAVTMTDSGPGLPYVWINNLAMERCKTAREAAEFAKGTPRLAFSIETPIIGQVTFYQNLNLLFADANGGIAAVEASHNYFAANYGISPNNKTGIQAQSNVHQYIDENLSGNLHYREDKRMVGSYMRLKRCWELLEKNYGSIDLEIIKSIMRDHAQEFPADYTGDPKYGESICNHRFDYGTICSIIIQPKEYIIWRCIGSPCANTYDLHDFN